MDTSNAQVGVALAAPRPFSVGRVLGQTFSLWARNGRAFLAVTAIIEAPAVALAFVVARRGGELDRLQSTVSSVLGLVAAGALTFGVLQALRGERPRARALLAAGLRKLDRIFWVSIAYQFLVTTGTVLLIVPGVVAAAGLFVAVPAAVAEPGLRDTKQMLWRSWALTKGRRVATFLVIVGALAFLLAVMAVAEAIVVAAEGAPWYVAPALEQAAFVVGSGVFFIAPAVAYHELRVEKEGVSADELVKVFE